MVCTSSITLGEMAAAHEMTNGDPRRRHQVKQWLNIYVIPYAVKVSEGTAPYYGNIMGRIWKKWPPGRNTSTESHLRARGVDVNDIWITASAWEHGLTLLTTDAMQSIRDVTPEVHSTTGVRRLVPQVRVHRLDANPFDCAQGGLRAGSGPRPNLDRGTRGAGRPSL